MNYAALALLLGMLAIYAWLVRRYSARRERPLPRGHAVAFVAMLFALYAALEPPLEPLADTSFLYHMAQHMLLIYVVAPLFLLSAPVMVLLGSVGIARARSIGGLLSSPLWRFLTFPVFAWLFFTVVMWGAHFSPLYELSLTNPIVHLFEHALFLGSAILFWQAIIHIGPVAWPMNFPLRIVYVFIAMPQSAFLGLALYQSKYLLYPHYLKTQGSAARALTDQQSGGALMWIVGGLLLFAVFMLVAAMWGRHERRLGEQFDAQLAAGSRALAIVGVACLLTGFGAGQARAATPPTEGEELFAVHCSSCHGANLEGSANGPYLRNVSRMKVEFYLTTGRMPASVPGIQNTRGSPRFTPSQIDALVGFVMSRSQGSNAVVAVDGTGNLQRGRTLFIANCSACHGATGKGGAVGYGRLAPNLDSATNVQVAQAIRIGPGIMPVFDPKTLDDAQVSDIVRFVEVLRANRPQAGGFAFDNVGAVAEGMVAWVLGLGLIVIVARVIGTNA
ncbi:MAG: cytochrome c oxidase assembly protein [Candidatus Baltobacteraceae bacterium]